MEIFKNIFRALLTKDKSERHKLRIKERNLKDLKFLAQKSSYFIEKQVESYFSPIPQLLYMIPNESNRKLYLSNNQRIAPK